MIYQKNYLSPSIVTPLLKWFDKNKRNLPWRKNPTPYSVWISEIMLQQTVLKTVIPYYNQWLKKYPDIVSLAKAKEREILTVWEGLGYYNRAKNILKAAKIIVQKHNSRIPDSFGELIQLPGIGDYTASAILSIAYNKAYPVVDANVKRVTQRLLGQMHSVKNQKKNLYQNIRSIISKNNPGAFNEALMELGQTICLIENPLCNKCPLRKSCIGFKNNLQDKIPERKSATYIKKETILLIMLYEDRILITKKESGILTGLWTFPNINKKKNAKLGLIENYIKNNISSDFSILKKLPPRIHNYTMYKDKLYPQVYKVKKPHKLTDKNWRWVKIKDLKKFPFPSVYRRILEDLKHNVCL